MVYFIFCDQFECCGSTSENGSNQSGDETSSINGQVKDGEKGASLFLLWGTALYCTLISLDNLAMSLTLWINLRPWP